MKKTSRPSGFILQDTVLALLLVVTLTTVLILSVGQRKYASQRLAAHRQALGNAQEMLCALQNRVLPPHTDGIVMIRMPDSAPAHFQWVKIQAQVNGQKASLVGLIPLIEPEAHHEK